MKGGPVASSAGYFRELCIFKLKKISGFKKKLNLVLYMPMKKVIIAIIITVTFTFMVVMTIFGQRGLVHLYKLQKKCNEIEQFNNKLQAENKKLKEEIDLLKHDMTYIEQLAREELGLVKENELIYHVEKNDNKN
ncbi:hypothetical protein GF366_01750 [Candidatus Peregrinibacteria bacterium]|nr:hypothetical protein [Candidatus Peregrinibacteria bacterium]